MMLKNILWGLFLSTIILIDGCAKHRVPLDKSSMLLEKKGVYHVVERHQSLYRICKTYEVDLKQVASLNRISDTSRIQTGQRIFIPGAKKALKVEIYIDDVVPEPGEGGKITTKKKDFIVPVKGALRKPDEEAA